LHNWSYITLKLRGIKTRALLDSGSYYSILSVDLARRLRIKIEPITDETNHTLFSANGTALRLEGTANVILDIAQLRISHEVYVCSNLSEQFLLGRSFLSQAGANLNFRGYCYFQRRF
jgi:predicted aspartyl protease